MGSEAKQAGHTAETIVEAFYRNFLLRDIFAKIVPGGIVLLALGGVLGGAFGQFRWSLAELDLGWVLFAGAAWINGFALQMMAEKFGFMRHHPDGYLDDHDERYAFRAHFMEQAEPAHVRRRERYAVIKEACGNGGFALLVAGLVLVVGWLAAGPEAFPEVGPTLVGGTAFVATVWALRRTNRSHRRKEYRFMNVINEKTRGPTHPLPEYDD